MVQRVLDNGPCTRSVFTLPTTLHMLTFL